MFYGNIGSDDRLDFTVVGPAVNEVSRIAAMCRSVDRDDRCCPSGSPPRRRSPSARGSSRSAAIALRGVGRAQELFTIDPQTL